MLRGSEDHLSDFTTYNLINSRQFVTHFAVSRDEKTILISERFNNFLSMYGAETIRLKKGNNFSKLLRSFVYGIYDCRI